MSEDQTSSNTTRGKRLDVAAMEMLPELSRAYVQKLIENKRILVDGAPQKPGHKLRENEKITTDFDKSELEKIPEIDLPVLFENEDVIVINKPAGVISHSRGKYWNEPSVASFVRQKTDQEGERSGIVHRLDRATSGVMICTKNQLAMKELQKQFSSRKVVKRYSAIVDGHLKPDKAVIDMPIERNPKAPAKFRVGANGKSAQTEYEVIKQLNKSDYVRLTPKTGRTHQLRVHMDYLKHPIKGDLLYNGSPADRLYLHALELELKLPGNKTLTKFNAPLPETFKKLIK